jgi:hypothetical protein
MKLTSWINNKIIKISKELPLLVLDNPKSFDCGFNIGYKHAMLDLSSHLNNDDKDISFYHCRHCSEDIALEIICAACGL